MKSRHAEVERELVDYFSGEHVGHMGLRSWLGPMLEHAQAATVRGASEPAWNGHSEPPGQFIAIAKGDEYVSSGDGGVMDRAVYAVCEQRRVRAALCALSSDDVAVLGAWYRPAPPAAPQGTLSIVAAQVGHDALRALQASAEKPGRGIEGEELALALARRVLAKATLRDHERRAKHALKSAQERYAEAREMVAQVARASRAQRFARAA